MFIYNKNLPNFAMIGSYKEGLPVNKGGKPFYLCTLNDTLWGNEVKEKIAKFYKNVGVQDPLNQKLVEPYAGAFGGQNKEGVADLSKVNWEMLVDYFKWEALAISDNHTKAAKVYKEAEKKHNISFSHYYVYRNFSTIERGDNASLM